MKLTKIIFFSFILTLGITVKSYSQSTTGQVIGNMPDFFGNIKSNLDFPLAWGKSEENNFTAWRKIARAKLMECLLTPPPEPDDYEVSVIGSEHREGYTVNLIEFNLSLWYRIRAYYLIPDGDGPFPGIVLLHDHGAEFRIGKEKMVRPFYKDSLAKKWVEKCYDGVFIGDYLAGEGYAVLITDALLWGDRGRKEGASYDSQQALASNLFQMGMCWNGIIAYDDIRSAEFLAGCPKVDPNRIASVGFSMGAYRAWMLAAATDIIKSAVSICWMNTTEYLMTLENNQNKGGSAYSMLIPDIRNYLDYPHTASIACPKPMLFINCREDKLFPIKGAEDAFMQMRAVWDSQGASQALCTELYDGGHFFSKQLQNRMLDFLKENL